MTRSADNIYHFVLGFVLKNEAKIKQDLQIEYLNIDETIAQLTEYITQHKETHNLIKDVKGYKKIINLLKNIKNSGAKIGMSSDEYIKHLKQKLHKYSVVN